MNNQHQEEKILRSSFHLAILESIADLSVILTFSCILGHISSGTIQYYGCILSLASIGFVLGVLWSFLICRRFLHSCLASNSFWHEVSVAHARLLRFLPFWYLIPVCSGVILFLSPSGDAQFLSYMNQLIIVLWLAGGVAWLNRHAAHGFEAFARKIPVLEK